MEENIVFLNLFFLTRRPKGVESDSGALLQWGTEKERFLSNTNSLTELMKGEIIYKENNNNWQSWEALH